MNRWLAGHNPIPAGLGDTILPILEKRYADIERLIDRLKGD